MLKDKYDILVLSSYLNSKLAAGYLSQKQNNIILVDLNKKKVNLNNDYYIYAYQEPFLSLKDKFYLNDFFSFVSLKNINNKLSKSTPLSVVFGDKKVYFHEDFVKHDIKAEFKNHASSILAFLDYIRIINEKISNLYLKELKYPPSKILDYYYFFKYADNYIIKYFNQNIDAIYKKFKLPAQVEGFFNAILFFLSGVKRQKYSCIPAIRLLSESLNGLCSYIAPDHIESSVNKILKSYMALIEDVAILKITKTKGLYNVRLNNYIGNIKTKYILKDSIDAKLNTLNINTLNVFVDLNYIPSYVGEYTLYVDCDKSYWYNLKDIFVLRIIKNETHGVICISSFNENNILVNKNIYIKMYNVLLKMFPFIDKGRFKIYPEFNNDDFENNINKYKINEESIIINESIKDKYCNNKNIFNCSRQVMANFGAEGSFISSIRVSQDILRSL